jgi:signal peptidase I
MEPLISDKAHGIELKPKSPSELKVGDVILYKSDFTTGLVIHRIIETGYDENGWYSIVKGDNNAEQDPGKVRFDQINGVLIGIIY